MTQRGGDDRDQYPEAVGLRTLQASPEMEFRGKFVDAVVQELFLIVRDMDPPEIKQLIEDDERVNALRRVFERALKIASDSTGIPL